MSTSVSQEYLSQVGTSFFNQTMSKQAAGFWDPGRKAPTATEQESFAAASPRAQATRGAQASEAVENERFSGASTRADSAQRGAAAQATAEGNREDLAAQTAAGRPMAKLKQVGGQAQSWYQNLPGWARWALAGGAAGGLGSAGYDLAGGQTPDMRRALILAIMGAMAGGGASLFRPELKQLGSRISTLYCAVPMDVLPSRSTSLLTVI